MNTIRKTGYKVILIAVLFIYMAWWSLVAFLNFPDSSLPVASNLSLYRTFDRVFYQRWGFFAPPPTDDERLYYVFKHTSDSTKDISFEIFENLLKEKNRKYLLNDDLTNLDYILHNTISPIEDMLRDGYDVYKYKHGCYSKADTCNYRNYMNRIRSSFNNTPYVKTLLKHAEIMHAKHRLDSNYKLQLVISLVDIHKYAERFSNKARTEQPYFKSDFYNLKTRSWETYIE